MVQNFFQPGHAAATSGENGFPNLPLLEATSPSMRAVVTVIRELAHNSVPVLLIGEHGTGKQAIAQQIHQNSGGLDEDLQVKGCRELMPESLAPAQNSSKTTLYLDEIGDLNLDCQTKLLVKDLTMCPRRGTRTHVRGIPARDACSCDRA